MGADGGVCWIEAKDEERFKELVEPFGFLFFDEYHWSNVEWLKENREPGKIYGTYGTGQDLCLLDIPQLLNEIEAIQEDDCDYAHIGFRDLTFSELAEDWETRPEFYTPGFPWWILDRIAKRICLVFPEGWKDVKIVDWGEELAELVIEKSTGSVETWT